MAFPPPSPTEVRFTISRHVRPSDAHYDLFIEQPELGSLAAWNFTAPPWELKVGDESTVARIFDHRLIYLEYQGPISGDRGTVEIVDTGSCLRSEWQVGKCLVRLAGRQTNGVFELTSIGESSTWVCRRRE